MSYSTLILKENVPSKFLCVVKPRRKLSSFTLVSGSVYKTDFDFTEYVSSVEQDGVALTMVSTSSLAAGQFFFDQIAKELYVRMTDSSNPSTKFVVGLYELYFSSYDAHWYRVPTDNTTLSVYYDPVIAQSPQLKSTISEVIQGVLPIQSTDINLINAEHIFEKHISDSSFSKAEFNIYHWLDDLETTNIKLVLQGIGANISYSDSGVKIQLLDGVDKFTKEWRNDTAADFYGLTDFPSVDPNFVGQPVRYVYGRVAGFVPVNIDFVTESPTTSDNRDWVCVGEQTGLAEKSYTVQAGSTTTQTNLNTVAGLFPGDTVWIDKASDEYREVLTVDYGSNFITHAALGSAAVAADTVKRGFVSRVDIIQNQTKYTAYYNRDYSVVNFANGTRGFSFNTSMESNAGLASTLSPSDQVYVSVYGPTNNVTIGGPAFGSDDSTSGNLASPAVILFHLLKTKLGLGESAINLTSFTNLLTSIPDEGIRLALPENSTEKQDSIKDVITKILKTSLIKLYLDTDLKWTVSLTEPLTASDSSIASDEILDRSFQYEFKYDQILSDLIVEFNKQEKSIEANGPRSNQVSSSSSNARHLHKIEKSGTFESLHFKESEAQILSDRLGFIYGERIGTITFKSKNRFFNSFLADIIEINRVKLPGFDFDPDITRVKSAVTQDVSKTLKDVTIVLNDQKGIEDNSSSW